MGNNTVATRIALARAVAAGLCQFVSKLRASRVSGLSRSQGLPPATRCASTGQLLAPNSKASTNSAENKPVTLRPIVITHQNGEHKVGDNTDII
jgi:hypothetical protein